MQKRSDPRLQRRVWRETELLVGVAIAAAVFAVSWRVTGFDWVLFDDDVNVLLNPHLACNPAKTFGWAFTNLDYIRRYLPLGWLQFDALLAIDGYNAHVFHLASDILHAANAALVWIVFRRVIRQTSTSAANLGTHATSMREMAAAGLGALLWSLHPLRAENVGWISGLLYLGSTTLALAATIVHLGAHAQGKTTGESWRRVVGTALFTSSLLVYPVFLALPALLTFRSAVRAPKVIRGAWAEARRLAGWWIAAGTIGAVNLYARATAVGAFAAPPNLAHMSFLSKVANGGRVVLYSAIKTIWPGSTSPYYGHTRELLHDPTAVPIATVLGFVVLGLLAWCATRRPTITLLIGALITLAPAVAQIDSSFSMADRYAMLWLAFWAVAVSGWLNRPRSRAADVAVAGTAIVVLTLSAFHYRGALNTWKDTAAVQAAIDRATADFPDPKMSYSRPAIAMWTWGHRDESARRFAEGFARFPRSADLIAAKEMVNVLEQRLQARLHGQTDIPPLAMMHVDLGREWLGRNEVSPAAAHFLAALRLAPNYEDAQRAYREIAYRK